MIRFRLSILLPLVLAWPLAAQTNSTQRPAAGVNREQMWWAPTAEDWKKPVLIQWQRTWEDAVALSKQTNKPILVCINMDGEIASEHYAGVRYRMPEIAALYEPYVTVIASVYRHSPRDFDEQGKRVLCPRFGTVTCGEHQAIEPILYEKFMDGRRIAPRHIMVELDGKEVYDVFYAWDTDSVFQYIKDGIGKRQGPPVTELRGDRTIVEKVASHDSKDRAAVEAAYLQGDEKQRRTLLEAALSRGEQAPVDLLRLGLFGFDRDLSKLARQGLAQAKSEGAIDLIAEAMRVPMEPKEREALIAALQRIGEASPRASTLASVHQGLATYSSAIDVEGWSKQLDGKAAALPDRGALETKLDGHEKAARSQKADAQAQLELAESRLAYAVSYKATDLQSRRQQRLLYVDAQQAAMEAEKLGASGWRLAAVRAIAEASLGETESAHRLAEQAVSGMPAEASTWNAMAVLALFAEARQKSILDALRARQKWPGQWLADVHAAYSVLARHPLGTDAQVVSHYDFLRSLGAAGQAARVLDTGLARFPASWLLHDRLRGKTLEEKGVDGLLPVYAALQRQSPDDPDLVWFAGYAAIVAAEFQRRAGQELAALAAYEEAVARFEASIARNPASKPTADHYIALALAGRARVEYERADYEAALAAVLASFQRRPQAAASQDGLNISPVDTAKMLLARLTTLKRDDLLAKLHSAMDGLDPEMLELPAYEREVGPDGQPRRR